MRAFTLMELAIYGFLLLLALGLIAVLLRDVRGLFGQVTGSYLVDRAMDRALAILRNDLVETALTSVRVYPAEAGKPGEKEPPGLTLASAGGNVTPEGVPRWSKTVFYTLEAQDKLTGNLLRWEVPFDPGPPLASTVLPSLSRSAGRQTVLAGVQLPETSVPGIAQSVVGPRGGFQVTFVRREGDKVTLSPTLGGTPLIDVELRVLKPRDSISLAHYAVVRLRHSPRSVP